MTGTLSLAFVLVALGQTAPEPADANLVQAFFKDHCVRCHNAKVQKGKFALDGLGPKIEGHRSSYTAILERLREREMSASLRSRITNGIIMVTYPTNYPEPAGRSTSQSLRSCAT